MLGMRLMCVRTCILSKTIIAFPREEMHFSHRLTDLADVVERLKVFKKKGKGW